MNYTSDCIYKNVKMADILQLYHKQGRNGRTSCPFHNGKDSNLSYSNEVWQCWVCGKKGNVITFVTQLFNINFNQAISKINYDFNLNLPNTKTLTIQERRRLLLQEKERKEQIEKELQKKELKREYYFNLLEAYITLDNIKRKYAPKTETDEFHMLYTHALKYLPLIEFKMDCEVI